jgi:hypothetical protein
VTKRLVVYAEGQTEELFVNRILRNHLALFGVNVERPILAATSREASGQRGEFVNWDAIEFDLRRIFADDADPHLRVTTLLDAYAMPTSVPGYESSVNDIRSPESIDRIEAAWRRHFDEPRFVPYIQRHEFETLVLADSNAIKAIFPNFSAPIDELTRAISGFTSIEDVDDGPSIHPSARLAMAIQGYGMRKPDHALFILQQADMGRIRHACPRFDAWLQRWENWGHDSDAGS